MQKFSYNYLSTVHGRLHPNIRNILASVIGPEQKARSPKISCRSCLYGQFSDNLLVILDSGFSTFGVETIRTHYAERGYSSSRIETPSSKPSERPITAPSLGLFERIIKIHFVATIPSLSSFSRK